jgi:hypothetical protein
MLGLPFVSAQQLIPQLLQVPVLVSGFFAMLFSV